MDPLIRDPSSPFQQKLLSIVEKRTEARTPPPLPVAERVEEGQVFQSDVAHMMGVR